MSSRSQRLTGASAERRLSNRLPIERDVRYKIFGGRRGITRVGWGKTVNMSSRGVLFTTESALPKGAHIELTVSWPAKLNHAVPLNLVARGVLVRVDENQAAVAMEKYEFRTRGAGREEAAGYRDGSGRPGACMQVDPAGPPL